MQIFHFDPATNAYLGTSMADESPLEPGVFLVPAYATEIEPPVCGEGQRVVFDGAAWRVEAIPQPESPPAEPAPAPVTPTIPEVVTMRQARLALLQTGLLTQVNTAVANMPGVAGDTARIEWEFSSTVERNRPLVQSLIGALGLTESQLDDLFRLAATL